MKDALIKKEEEATVTCSSLSAVPLTNLMCAFFNSALFVNSKIPVIVRNKAQSPIWEMLRDRVSKARLKKPKKVRENRCRKV